MPLEAMVIILFVGIFMLYIFYLISIYIKLENRRSLILSKFVEVDNQMKNKLDIIKDLLVLVENEELDKCRVDLLNSTFINDKIKYNKDIDRIINNITCKDKKVNKIINLIKEVNYKINYSKEFYNDSLYEYNIILSTFSGKILKKFLKYSCYNTF